MTPHTDRFTLDEARRVIIYRAMEWLFPWYVVRDLRARDRREGR